MRRIRVLEVDTSTSPVTNRAQWPPASRSFSQRRCGLALVSLVNIDPRHLADDASKGRGRHVRSIDRQIHLAQREQSLVVKVAARFDSVAILETV